jgi:ATP-dependent Lon protease
MPEGKTSQAQDDGPLVLLVDDSEDDRELAVALLRRAGYRVGGLPSALHALQMLERERVAVVLVSQELPGMEGLRLLLIVKERFSWVRRVLMMDKPTGDLVLRAKMHADARALPKPVRPSVLERVVKEEIDAYAAENTRPR